MVEPTHATSTDLFWASVDAAERLLADEAVAARWDEDSALEGYTIGGLAGHLARAVLTVDRYLDAPASADVVDTLDAAGYFAAVLGDDDPVDSDKHRMIRDRSVQAADGGHEKLLQGWREQRARLGDRLDEHVLRRTITVLGGIDMTVADYLDTRLVELVVHVDDLATSLGRDPDGLPAPAYERVAAVLAATAAKRVGGLDVVRSLARRERHPEAVRAL